MAYQQAVLGSSQSAGACKNIRKKNEVQTSFERHLVLYFAYAYGSHRKRILLDIPYILPDQRIQYYRDHLPENLRLYNFCMQDFHQSESERILSDHTHKQFEFSPV